jgi:transcriptional regulator with XRE-family HTH domain
MSGQESRNELAQFLKSRRRQISPETVGLSTLGHRRTAGLRREEVSYLSGVSVTWYTWLEQGRDIRPSRQVVDALARTLRLSAAEHDYVRRLTSDAEDARPRSPDEGCPSHVQRLLDALGASPAYALTAHWAIVGWNRAYEAFYPNVATTPATERNLLSLVFTDPYVRGLLVDWRTDSRRFLGQFRAEAGLRVHEPEYARVIGHLRQVSEHFRTGWERHDVDRFTSRERQFEHPTAGTLLLEHHRLAVSDHPDLHLVVYTAMPGSGTQPRLDALVSAAAPA